MTNKAKETSLPTLQQEVLHLYQENDWNTDPILLILAMQEELGELAGRWLAEHPGYKKSLENTTPIDEEVGDLLHLILAFCNTQGINFETVVRNTIEKRRQ